MAGTTCDLDKDLPEWQCQTDKQSPLWRSDRPVSGGKPMVRSYFIVAAAVVLGLAGADAAFAEETVKIGFILPMTGQQQSTGKQEAAGSGSTWRSMATLLLARRSNSSSGRRGGSRQYQADRSGTDRQRKGGVPGRLRRHARRALGRAAFGRIEDAGNRHRGRHLDHHREISLYRPHQLHAGAIDRADGRLGGRQRHQESRDDDLRLRAGRGRGKVVRCRVQEKGRGGLESIRFPLANPDFAPFLQRAADQKPDAIFVFVPSGQGGTFVKQFVERGLDKAGIKIIGPGDVMDDDLLPGMGDAVIGTVTRTSILGRSRFGAEQGVRRRLQEGQ